MYQYFLGAKLGRISVRPGGVKDYYLLNTTETGDNSKVKDTKL